MPTHENASEEERRAWDLYAASWRDTRMSKPDPGTESRDAANHADELLAERRKRFTVSVSTRGTCPHCPHAAHEGLCGVDVGPGSTDSTRRACGCRV